MTEKIMTASDIEARYKKAGEELQKALEPFFEPLVIRAAEILEQKCKERHQDLKYSSYDSNANYFGYEGL
jgi:hypothetical protein